MRIIADLAAGLSATILTRDQDFATLLAMNGARAASLVNLRHSRTDAMFLADLLDAVLRQHGDLLRAGAILTLDERGVRAHLLPVALLQVRLDLRHGALRGSRPKGDNLAGRLAASLAFRRCEGAPPFPTSSPADDGPTWPLLVVPCWRGG